MLDIHFLSFPIQLSKTDDGIKVRTDHGEELFADVVLFATGTFQTLFYIFLYVFKYMYVYVCMYFTFSTDSSAWVFLPYSVWCMHYFVACNAASTVYVFYVS